MKNLPMLILHLFLAAFMAYIAAVDPELGWKITGIVLFLTNSLCAGVRIQMIIAERRKENEEKTNHHCC